MVHRARVRSRVITITRNPEIVVDGVMSDTLEVELDSEWEPYDSIKVIFTNGEDDDNPIEIEWEPSIVIPWEKLLDVSTLHLSVCGYVDGTQRAITQLMRHPFIVVQRGVLECPTTFDPTQDAYEKAYEDVLRATREADDAESQRVEAEAARADAEAARVIAELGRVEAEDGRVAAEAARVRAEEIRVSSEAARALETANVVADATQAAEAAWDAAARESWHIDGHTFCLGATAYISHQTIILGR